MRTSRRFTQVAARVDGEPAASGTFPGYAPYPFQHGWDFGTAWCDAGVICPWTIWQAYGDTRIIEQCWPFMVRFLDWRKATSRDFLGINHRQRLGRLAQHQRAHTHRVH